MSEVLTPAVSNLTLTVADTEYSVALPAGCKYFTFQCRTAADIRFAFVTGKVAAPAAPWMTLKSGQTFNSPEKLTMIPAVASIFFAGDAGGEIVEFIAWS